ncbi:MAG: hypothetical protein ACK5IC_00505, partial [Moheibacter sp.]
NGYGQKHTNNVDPMGWDGRKTALSKLKSWFKYNKNVCDGQVPLQFEGRAPWMELAITEATKAKGVKESEAPLFSMATSYHNYVGRTGNQANPTKGDNAWCASFASWVLGKSDYENPKTAGSRFFIDHSTLKKIETPIYGAIAVYSNCSSDGSNVKTSGHVNFVFGKLPKDYGGLSGDGIYACLGGNQSNKLNAGVYDITGKVFKNGSVYKICRGLYVPKNYDIKQIDYLTEQDQYENTAEANKKLMNVELNTTSNDSTL